MNNTFSKESAINIFYAALQAVDPYRCVELHMDHVFSMDHAGKFDKLYLIGFGKAAFPMSQAIMNHFIGRIAQGIIVTKYGHALDSDIIRNIKVFEAGHPIPDENGLEAAKKIMELLIGADQRTIVICLISGGGSALLVSPCDGITLSEKQKTTDLLLKAGANINELNTVRKHISRAKGGRLAEIANPANMLSLILSDVIGDRLDVIASGPTSPDKTTYGDALTILKKYHLSDSMPRSVLNHLQHGLLGNIPETPKEGSFIFNKVKNIIVGSNRIATDAAKKKAEELGYHATIISNEVQGEAREVGSQMARMAMEKVKEGDKKRICLITGGETTVTVKGSGLGGRNMELALSFAVEIDGLSGITLLSAGTDGTDGPTNAAGAIVDGKTIKKASPKGLDPKEFLKNNDSYNFFKQIDELLITGPTGTNVMDIQIVLIEKDG